MKRAATAAGLAIAGLIGGTLALPADAALQYTLPLSYQRLTIDGQQAQGVFVPLIWLQSPRRPLGLELDAGYGYLGGSTGGFSLIGGRLAVNLGIPLEGIFPFVGVEGYGSYAVSRPTGIDGNPYGVAPRIGLKLDLGLIEADLHASYGPVWGLSGPLGALNGERIDLGGRLRFVL
ncbi:hypothetical protein D3C87_1193560 [compost metagenome]